MFKRNPFQIPDPLRQNLLAEHQGLHTDRVMAFRASYLDYGSRSPQIFKIGDTVQYGALFQYRLLIDYFPIQLRIGKVPKNQPRAECCFVPLIPPRNVLSYRLSAFADCKNRLASRCPLLFDFAPSGRPRGGRTTGIDIQTPLIHVLFTLLRTGSGEAHEHENV